MQLQASWLLSEQDVSSETKLVRRLRQLLATRMGGGYVGRVYGNERRVVVEIPTYLVRRKRYHFLGFAQVLKRQFAAAGFACTNVSKSRTYHVDHGQSTSLTIGGIRVVLACRVHSTVDDFGTTFLVWERQRR